MCRCINRDHIKKVIAILLTVILFLCGLYKIENLTKLKSSSARDLEYASYFASPNDYDVIFMGSSHVMHGISPMDLWENYGITSYNWGSPTCTLPTTYWKLRLLLETARPKLIVVDCLRAEWTDKSYSVERMHEAFDAFRFSSLKYQAVEDLMDDPEKYTDKDKLDVLFKLSAYHSRWDSLSEIDFVNDYIDTKGGEYLYGIETVKAPDEDVIVNESIEMEGVNYLKKIIELCKEQDIPLVLTYLPYPYGKMEAKMIDEIANEYGVPYINLSDMDAINGDIDYNDSSQSYAHLNVSGNKKVTNYIGQYISENCGIEDKRTDELISRSWEENYQSFIDYRLKNLRKTKILDRYLMQLYGLPVDVAISVEDCNLAENPNLKKLVKNILPNAELDDLPKSYIIRNPGEDGEMQDLSYENKGDDSNIYIEVYREGELIDSVGFVCGINMGDFSIETISAER